MGNLPWMYNQEWSGCLEITKELRHLITGYFLESNRRWCLSRFIIADLFTIDFKSFNLFKNVAKNSSIEKYAYATEAFRTTNMWLELKYLLLCLFSLIWCKTWSDGEGTRIPKPLPMSIVISCHSSSPHIRPCSLAIQNNMPSLSMPSKLHHKLVPSYTLLLCLECPSILFYLLNFYSCFEDYFKHHLTSGAFTTSTSSRQV